MYLYNLELFLQYPEKIVNKENEIVLEGLILRCIDGTVKRRNENANQDRA